MIFTILENIKFELAIRKKQISTYVYFILFFSIALLISLAAGGAFKGVNVTFGLSNKVLVNSPIGISLFVNLLTAFGLFLIAPVFGQAVFKDYSCNFDQILHATPMHRHGFLLGRFLGALVTMLMIFSGVGLGIYVSTQLPMMPERILGINLVSSYMRPYLLGVIPNTFVFGSIFFLLASKIKKMAPVYVAGILIFMGWNLSGQFTSDLENKLITSLIDPFGIGASAELTKYWSAAEQNIKQIKLESYYLYNRLLWVGIGFVTFLISIFTFNEKINRSPARKKRDGVNVIVEATRKIITAVAPRQDFSLGSHLNMFKQQFFFELKQIFKSIYFQMILLTGVLYIFMVSTQLGKLYGTTTLPVTYKVLELMGGAFDLFVIIIITIYAGDVVWRERQNKIDQVFDAFPTPVWVSVGAKYLSLVMMTLFLFMTVGVCGIVAQAFKGYYQFELAQYGQYLFQIKMISFLNIITLAFFLQVVCKNRYVAYGLMILYYVAYAWLPSLGFEHKLYRFNAAPLPEYSDMNLYGRFLLGYYSFKFYWLSLSAILLTSTFLLWQRGVLTDFSDRFIELKRRLNKKYYGALAFFLVVFVSLGSFIFNQTNRLNHYETAKEMEANQHQYELKYKKYDRTNIPIVSAVKAFVDIYPYRARVKATMHYTFINRGNEPIKHALLHVSRKAKMELEFDIELEKEFEDKVLGLVIYKFKKPLGPGEKFKLLYKVDVDYRAFPNGRPNTNIVRNGTFFNNFSEFFPVWGYQRSREIAETKTRAKYGLKKKDILPDQDDAYALQFPYFSGGWIDYEAVVSTAADQIAISPGYLQKEWTEKGRRYFHYKMDQKILNFYSFLSARYTVKRDKWNDVNIEVYYHKTHDKNIDLMIDSTKKSLDYFTKNFSPYQHKQFRIIEFPRYETFAQAFPNTIPFSEGIGFIADVNPEDPEDVDYPFYITSHEMAHQWWAHQVIGAGVKGGTVMSETFSQYSALRVMEEKYGLHQMKKFLKYELDRYLSGRKNENEQERPLYLNESQGYIHYRKGSLVMYALKDYFGESLVNETLRDYLKKYAYQSAPFTTSMDFIDLLKSKTDKKDHDLIDDLFMKIVLFENRPTQASMSKKGDKYQVTMTISGKKYYADEDGNEVPKKFEQPIYVGIMNDKDDFIYLEKHVIRDGDNELVIEVDQKPSKVAVDPLYILVDKNPDDNEMKI